ncbi:hypothetical protein STAS_10345 [Striga asiatica]|uniref:Uncharacterized protein n=1 Tax=Striga asiatica TaxID=4170 RepID=A0A5A7PN41_STRAF|nr:hypothetical protein STAS_10345 [Striga asiatica]
MDKPFESLKGAEDVSINVLEFNRNMDAKVEPKEDPDATENSSSFADTISANENSCGLSDADVESQFFGESDLASPLDGLANVFPVRKKKLTAQWRNFIHPLMWRCKWTELRIKELESQASKYAREISINDQGKHKITDQVAVEQSGSKSLPFTHFSHRKKLMKRRKRKRVELTTDITSFMSGHVLFCERENKKADLDAVPRKENLGNSDQQATGQDEFGIHDDYVFPEDNNNNFLEHVLRKIETVHARVNKLKDKLSLVMTNNASRFSSSENLSQLVACDLQMSSGPSPSLSACNEDTLSVGGSLYTSPPQHMSDYDFENFAVSSFGQAIPIPDIIESTVGLLSSVDVTQHHAQVGDSSERIVDNMLLQNETTEIEKAQDAENSGEEENNDSMLLASEADMASKGVATAEHSTLKSCLSTVIHFPKNKRKRGERKAASSNWSRQQPSVPDT